MAGLRFTEQKARPMECLDFDERDARRVSAAGPSLRGSVPGLYSGVADDGKPRIVSHSDNDSIQTSCRSEKLSEMLYSSGQLPGILLSRTHCSTSFLVKGPATWNMNSPTGCPAIV